jgi:hypothetical protein
MTVAAVGVLTAILAAARPGSIAALRFLAVPLTDVLVFSVLVGAAIKLRNRADVHKRLMTLASLSLLGPAVARLPFRFIETGGPKAFIGLVDFCVIVPIVFDSLKNRRLHPAFLFGGLFLFASQPLRVLLADTNCWLSFATFVVNLVR